MATSDDGMAGRLRGTGIAGGCNQWLTIAGEVPDSAAPTAHLDCGTAHGTKSRETQRHPDSAAGHNHTTALIFTPRTCGSRCGTTTLTATPAVWIADVDRAIQCRVFHSRWSHRELDDGHGSGLAPRIGTRYSWGPLATWSPWHAMPGGWPTSARSIQGSSTRQNRLRVMKRSPVLGSAETFY